MTPAPGPVDLRFDAAMFRQVIGNFMSGVVVITTRHDGQPYGMTVSAVSSLSMEPPMLLVCLHSASVTQEAVARSGRFAVNVLAEDQGHLAERFARSGPAAEKFDGVGVRSGHGDVPLLEDALAVVECQVSEVVAGGTHRVFLAHVVQAEAGQGAPLAYFRGKFGKLELAQDAQTYEEVRRLVLTRALGPDVAVEVEGLARQLSAPASSVYYALTRLVGDNLLLRDPERGYVVRPVDPATSDDAHDAQLAIELGAAELTVGRLDSDQLAQYRRLAVATGAHLADGHLTDVGSYIAANAAFHAYPIRATGIRALVEAYDHLSLPELMSRVLTSDVEVSAHLLDDHRALVDAYEQADLPVVKQIITAHNERAKATQRAGIERAGGRV